jgi:hypothetical protein
MFCLAVPEVWQTALSLYCCSKVPNDKLPPYRKRNIPIRGHQCHAMYRRATAPSVKVVIYDIYVCTGEASRKPCHQPQRLLCLPCHYIGILSFPLLWQYVFIIVLMSFHATPPALQPFWVSKKMGILRVSSVSREELKPLSRGREDTTKHGTLPI